MKRLTCSDWIVLLLVISLLVLLGALFIWYTDVTASTQLSPIISVATCSEAFLEWNVDDYTYSQIEQVRIIYYSDSGIADLSTSKYYDMGTLHWWRTDVPAWFVRGHIWDVTGVVYLKNSGRVDTSNVFVVDCRYRVYLPRIGK